LFRARCNIKARVVRRFRDGSRLVRLTVRQMGDRRVKAQLSGDTLVGLPLGRLPR